MRRAWGCGGCKTTREVRDFGQCQVLFLAESDEDLLQQIRRVPLEEYRKRRRPCFTVCIATRLALRANRLVNILLGELNWALAEHHR